MMFFTPNPRGARTLLREVAGLLTDSCLICLPELTSVA